MGKGGNPQSLTKKKESREEYSGMAVTYPTKSLWCSTAKHDMRKGVHYV